MMATESLPLEKIRTNENQPRKTFYQESLEELSASIKERGVLQPIVVRPLGGGDAGFYQIVMGERRFRASKMAGLTHIPAIIRNLSDEDAAADSLLENLQREDMNPVERARAIQQLLQFMSYEKVSKTLGVSETTLRRSLELLELPGAIQQELVTRPGVGEGAFIEGHARALIAMNDDPGCQLRLAQKVKQEKLNVSDLDRLVNAIKNHPQKKEAFLRVPVSVTDQMLKSLGAKEERKRPYKAQTAETHLKVIDKAAGSLSELLDDRIGEFLSAEHMNQLLATTAELSRELEHFNTRIREALANKDFGFRESTSTAPCAAAWNSSDRSAARSAGRSCAAATTAATTTVRMRSAASPARKSSSTRRKTLRTTPSPTSARCTSPSSKRRPSSSRWPPDRLLVPKTGGPPRGWGAALLFSGGLPAQRPEHQRALRVQSLAGHGSRVDEPAATLPDVDVGGGRARQRSRGLERNPACDRRHAAAHRNAGNRALLGSERNQAAEAVVGVLGDLQAHLVRIDVALPHPD
jgi:ParB family chromosome partitioning protein